jgi:hypothetical protein
MTDKSKPMSLEEGLAQGDDKMFKTAVAIYNDIVGSQHNHRLIKDEMLSLMRMLWRATFLTVYRKNKRSRQVEDLYEIQSNLMDIYLDVLPPESETMYFLLRRPDPFLEGKDYSVGELFRDQRAFIKPNDVTISRLDIDQSSRSKDWFIMEITADKMSAIRRHLFDMKWLSFRMSPDLLQMLK